MAWSVVRAAVFEIGGMSIYYSSRLTPLTTDGGIAGAYFEIIPRVERARRALPAPSRERREVFWFRVWLGGFSRPRKRERANRAGGQVTTQLVRVVFGGGEEDTRAELGEDGDAQQAR